jgi:hypothetical protein
VLPSPFAGEVVVAVVVVFQSREAALFPTFLSHLHGGMTYEDN